MPKDDLRTECSGVKVIVSVVSVFFVVASFHLTIRSAFLVVCCVCLRLSVCVCACALGDVYPFCRLPVGFGGVWIKSFSRVVLAWTENLVFAS